MRVGVVGCGVVGLSAGIALRTAGFDVTLLGQQPPPLTNSANAGAIWGPFLSEIDPRVFEWSFSTREKLVELAATHETGVSVCRGRCYADFDTEMPDWTRELAGGQYIAGDHVPSRYRVGWTYVAPIVDTPTYMSFLFKKYLEMGGNFRKEDVHDLDELSNIFDFAINCAGFGAAKLARDSSMYQSKGQLVVIENPGLEEFVAERGDGPELMYILPQGEKAVLGGTAELTWPHSEVDAIDATEIVARCAAVEPRVASSTVLGHRVGFRPCRPTVRVERDESIARIPVVHNYGHGGSGISLSWACAEEVVTLVTNG